MIDGGDGILPEQFLLRDERAGGKVEEFHYEGGISDFVAYVNSGKDPIHKHVVEVMEAARKAGLKNLAIATRPEQ